MPKVVPGTTSKNAPSFSPGCLPHQHHRLRDTPRSNVEGVEIRSAAYPSSAIVRAVPSDCVRADAVAGALQEGGDLSAERVVDVQGHVGGLFEGKSNLGVAHEGIRIIRMQPEGDRGFRFDRHSRRVEPEDIARRTLDPG